MRIKGRSVLIIMVFLLVVGVFSGCINIDALPVIGGGTPAPTDDTILFALPGPLYFMSEASHFLKGVEMAVDEVNEAGLLGRQVGTLVADDAGSFVEGTAIAQRFVADPRVAGVVGHWHSHITLPASTIYEEGRKILLSPVVSNVRLTQRGYRNVFQNIPGDDEIGRQMALFARDSGYTRIVLLYADSPYGRGLANAFEDVAHDLGLVVVDRRHGFVDNLDLTRTVRLWNAMGFDAVFMAYGMPDGGDLIARLKRAGVDVPFLGGDGLDFELIESLGAHAEDVVVATIFNPLSERSELRDFQARFSARFGHEPDVWAIQGYDSIKLLAHAIARAGTTETGAVADVLRGLEAWEGVLSRYSFNERGEAVGMTVYPKVVEHGTFVYLQ